MNFSEFTAERNSKVTYIDDFLQTTLLSHDCSFFLCFLVSGNRAPQNMQVSSLAIRKFSASEHFGIKRSKSCLLQYFPKPKSSRLLINSDLLLGLVQGKTFFPTPNESDRFYRHCLLKPEKVRVVFDCSF